MLLIAREQSSLPETVGFCTPYSLAYRPAKTHLSYIRLLVHELGVLRAVNTY